MSDDTREFLAILGFVAFLMTLANLPAILLAVS